MGDKVVVVWAWWFGELMSEVANRQEEKKLPKKG